MPDKAIDVIDEASSKVRLKASNMCPEGKELEKQLKTLIKEKEDAIRNQEFETASQLRDDEADLRDKIREVSAKWREEHDANKPTVTAENVAEVVAMMTGVPVTKLTEGESERLLKLEDTLHQRVIGQHDAIVAISKAIRRARVGLKSPNRPIGSFIFCGPTGVGKTELAKALAEAMFGSEDNMIRVDMSEFMENIQLQNLSVHLQDMSDMMMVDICLNLLERNLIQLYYLTKLKKLTQMFSISCCKYWMTVD